jgi:DNA-binding MarR family transcriptional regulator
MDAQLATPVSLVRELTRATRAVTARVEPVLKAEGLTLDQWLATDVLAGSAGATMTELAVATALTGPTLTRVVDRLVMLALVFREVDNADRRRVRVYLSPRGRATHRRLAAQLAELERTVLARVSTPNVLTALGQLST